jgi:hypothetical protein
MKILDFRNMQTIEEWLKEQETDPDVLAMYEYHNKDYESNCIMEERARMTCSQRKRQR